MLALAQGYDAIWRAYAELEMTQFLDPEWEVDTHDQAEGMALREVGL